MLLLRSLYVTDRMSSDQNVPLLLKRYLPLVSVHETHNKRTDKKKHTKDTKWQHQQKSNIFKHNGVFFQVWNQIQNVQQKWESRTKETHEGSSVSVKVKPSFWICSCSLPIGTPDSLSMHVTSRALWHTTTPSPFKKKKILMRIIIITHTHTHNHTFQTTFFPLQVWASWCLGAKSRTGTACDVELIKSLKKKKKIICEANLRREGVGMIAWR